MSLEIEIDRRACRGARECLRRAPRTFALDEERRAIVTDASGDGAQEIVSAARACPNFAITVRRGRDVLT